MGRGRRLQSSDDFNRALKNKYGLGVGKDYKPWLRVQDVKSNGMRSQIWSHKTGREHHLLSSIESQFFYLAEYSDLVVDIREQFPLLPINLSQKIARTIDVKHPIVPSTKTPNVMTTDFLLTCHRGNKPFYKAVAVKPEGNLDLRTAEKLEIERIWWELLGIEFSIFTGNERTRVQSRNLRWASSPYRSSTSFFEHADIEASLNCLSEGRFLLSDLCSDLNSVIGSHREDGLKMIRFLISRKLIFVDLSHPIDHDGVIQVLSVNQKNMDVANGY